MFFKIVNNTMTQKLRVYKLNVLQQPLLKVLYYQLAECHDKFVQLLNIHHDSTRKIIGANSLCKPQHCLIFLMII